MQRFVHRAGWGIAGALAITLLATIVGVIYAGPLDPPAGVTMTTSTQKYLVYQPFSPAGYPIVITVGGSYVLAQDIGYTVAVPAGKDAIHIAAAGVTLDLDGHTIFGGGTGVNGIVGAPVQTIRNGVITGFTADGITLAAAGTNTVQNVMVYGNGEGINLGDNSTLSECNVFGNTGQGIFVSGLDSTVKGCNVTHNGAQGIHALGARVKILGNHAADNASTSGCADIWVSGPNDIAEGNSAEGSALGHCPFLVEGAGDIVERNTAHSASPAFDYEFGVSCPVGCDIGTVAPASAATGNPNQNVAE
jgi:parallel beta-helix repeat protein